MSGGLLDGFHNVMAGLSADDVERANQSPQPMAHAGPPAATGSTRCYASAVNSHSRALARRILGPGFGADVPAVAGPVPLRCVPITGGAEIELDESSTGVVVIGRADGGVRRPDRQLVIDRAVVSRRHCQVIVTTGGFGVIDLGAANATGVLRNGSLVQVTAVPFLLQPGDLISTLHGEYPMVHVEAVRS